MCSSELYNKIIGCPLCEQVMVYKYLFRYTALTFALGFYIKSIRVNEIKSLSKVIIDLAHSFSLGLYI